MPTRMLAQLGWRWRTRRLIPNPIRMAATSQRSLCRGMTAPTAMASMMAAPTASACPTPSGNNADSTAPRRRSCKPSATANSHPIPGLIPWKAPSPSSAAHELVISPIESVSRKTVRVRRRVAALEMHLVRAKLIDLEKELVVQPHSAVIGIDFGHPALNPAGIELLVPGAIERVGHVNPLAIAADLHHLRRPIQGFPWILGMRLLLDQP